jgi:glycosyltransferase involved in cell wall biosynthesis
MINGKTTVLHVMPSLLSPAGTPRKLLNLVQNCDLEKFKHVFLLFCNHQSNLCDEIRLAGGIVEEVYRPKNYDLRLFFDMRRMIRKHKSDIINTHFPRSDILGAIVGLMCGVPVIKSVHGIIWKGSKLFIYMDRLLARFRYVTTCNSHASLEAERKRSHAKKLKVIHNGVVPRECKLSSEEARAFRHKLGIPLDSFLVGHVGGLIELRRQDLIIDAVSILYEKGIDVFCAIAGKGPEESRLKKYAKSLNIVDRVRFLGYIDGVSEFLTSIDVFVNMARSEGFGIAVVEAMFAGAPVVLAKAGAHQELIVNGESGILVSEGSSQELAGALTRLAEESFLRQRLGEGGKKKANEKFTISRFVRDFENLYETCVKETLERVA